MVKSSTQEVFSCEVCGEDFYSEKLAQNCERVHKEGIIIKDYLHRHGSLSETEEDLKTRYSGKTFSEDQIELIHGLFYEVEIEIKVMDDSVEIIGIKKEKALAKDLRRNIEYGNNN